MYVQVDSGWAVLFMFLLLPVIVLIAMIYTVCAIAVLLARLFVLLMPKQAEEDFVHARRHHL
jgi:hypothetical protein